MPRLRAPTLRRGRPGAGFAPCLRFYPFDAASRSPCSSTASGGGSCATRYSNWPRNSCFDEVRGRGQPGHLLADPRGRRAAAGSCSGARSHTASRLISTIRTFVRPVWPSIISENGIGMKWPPCMEIIAAFPPASEVFRRAVAEVARVFHVERNRIGAAQLVADVLLRDRRLDPEPAQPLADLRLQHVAEVHFGQPDVAVGVAFHVLEIREIALARCRAPRLRRSPPRRRAGPRRAA